MYTLEQLEVLMLVAEADDPAHTALALRRRWAYLLRVAEGACQDPALPQVERDRAGYVRRARLILAALDEWFAQQMPGAAGW